MAKTIQEVMTPNPVTMQADESAASAARQMRDNKIGDVLVLKKGKLCGIVTDRDIVVRAVAEGKDPETCKLEEMCSDNVVTAAANSSIDEVISLMRERAVRRIPVVRDGTPVGIVSLGDMAVERDRRSVLGAISAAPAQT